MVKARRGLLLSLLTLLVAIVVTTTSTYAWFAMNSSVSATNMQVTVVADKDYLIISNTAPASGKFTADDVGTTTLASVAANTEVLPTRLKSGSTTTSNMTWQTATGTSINDGSAKDNAYTDITSGINKYVVQYSFWIGLNPTYSAVNASNLKITNVELTKVGSASNEFLNAVSFVVVCDDAVKDNYFNEETDDSLAAKDTVLAATINKDGTPVKVDVYVYINGDNANVKSANATKLGGYTLALTFGVTPDAA